MASKKSGIIGYIKNLLVLISIMDSGKADHEKRI
jgi:hypothetical protein